MISAEEVKRLARLSRLSYTDEQIPHITQSINEVLEYVALLEKVTIPSTILISSTQNINSMREDYIKDFPSKSILECAPDKEEMFFTVPAIIKNKEKENA